MRLLFFAIKIHEAAGIPVLPVSQGIAKAKRHIVLHIAAFAVVAALLPLTGYVGIGFMVVALATSLWWLAMALRGYRLGIDVNKWARQVFFSAIITVTALSVTMALDFNEVSPNLLVFAAH